MIFRTVFFLEFQCFARFSKTAQTASNTREMKHSNINKTLIQRFCSFRPPLGSKTYDTTRRTRNRLIKYPPARIILKTIK